jgi:hypothetical protein
MKSIVGAWLVEGLGVWRKASYQALCVVFWHSIMLVSCGIHRLNLVLRSFLVIEAKKRNTPLDLGD